jgi:hypothetical protein
VEAGEDGRQRYLGAARAARRVASYGSATDGTGTQTLTDEVATTNARRWTAAGGAVCDGDRTSKCRCCRSASGAEKGRRRWAGLALVQNREKGGGPRPCTQKEGAAYVGKSDGLLGSEGKGLDWK